MKSLEYIKTVVTQFKVKPGSEMRSKVLDEAMKIQRDRQSSSDTYIWRIIMKSPITKIAAAVVMVIIVLAAINYFGGTTGITSVAVADVVQPLLLAETGSFNMTVDLASTGIDWVDYGDQSYQTIKVTFAGPSLTRWDFPSGEVLVANFEQGKVMILMSAKKQAMVMQVSPPGVIPPVNRFNQLMAIRPLVQYALENEDDSVEYLGEREVNGVPAVGYYLKGPTHHGDIKVWADTETKMPIRIERDMKLQNQSAVIGDISYDIEVNESLFSVEPPEGYALTVPDEAEPDFVISGTVTDAATGEPVTGARVEDDGYGSEPYRGAVTDTQGKYQYNTWAEEHNIVAKAPGYKPQRKGITGLFHTEPGNKVDIDFKLERE
jgi:outer membrane lipoprotein-sorting protein